VKIKILATSAIAAVALTASGAAMATTISSAPHTTAKACVASNGDLKLVQSGRCPRGSTPFTMIAKGGPGTALGYAHIKFGDIFDATRSYNVGASNVVTDRAGFLCFRGLKFTPHIAVVTLDYNGILNGQIPQATVMLPAEPSLCGLSSAQAEIFTGLVNTGVMTTGAKLGFYIVFY
jgi:hypothetical protein